MIIHSIGRISLVSNVDVSRSALVIDGEPTAVDAGGDDGSGNSESDDASGEDDLDDGDGLDEEEEDRRRDRRRRRLMEALEEIEDDAEASKDPSLLGGAIDRIREEAVALFSGEASTSIKSSIQSPDWDENAEEEEEEAGAVSDGERVREEDGGVDGGDNKSDITEPSRAKSGSEDEDDAEEAPLRLATTFLARTEEEPSIMLFEDDSASTAETETTGSSQADSSSEGEDYAYGVPPQLATTFLDRTDEEVSIMMFNDDSTSMTTRRMLGRNSVGAGSLGSKLPPWSDIVMPYPFVRDDKSENIRKTRTPAARRMPPREQLLEANAASCEFEINMDVQETEWTVGAWRNLLTRRFREAKKLDPASQEQSVADSDAEAIAEKIDPRSSIRGSRSKTRQDQALVMTIIGTIHSDNCNFHAALNATALRTDWEATTAKAINYSMYMTLVCLTQMLVLLRQLLHSQSQSAATRVSLLCVGWQTVIDALLCLVHIYLSLAMQPLFTAFASVAFFKLLIFCVIEMKVRVCTSLAQSSISDALKLTHAFRNAAVPSFSTVHGNGNSSSKQQQRRTNYRSFEASNCAAALAVLPCPTRYFPSGILHRRKVPHRLRASPVLLLGAANHSEHIHRGQDAAAQSLHIRDERFETGSTAVHIRRRQQLPQGGLSGLHVRYVHVRSPRAVGWPAISGVDCTGQARRPIHDPGSLPASQVRLQQAIAAVDAPTWSAGPATSPAVAFILPNGEDFAWQQRQRCANFVVRCGFSGTRRCDGGRQRFVAFIFAAANRPSHDGCHNEEQDARKQSETQ